MHNTETTLFTNIVFVIQICNERNSRIFCSKNQRASSWHININGWRQHEYWYMYYPDNHASTLSQKWKQ